MNNNQVCQINTQVFAYHAKLLPSLLDDFLLERSKKPWINGMRHAAYIFSSKLIDRVEVRKAD